MTITVKLSDELITSARRYGEVHCRSISKQIEYWCRIGKIAEDNPDLPYSFIKDILISLQEQNDNEVTPYEFD